MPETEKLPMMDAAVAEGFVLRARCEVSPTLRSCCVDGRYAPNDAKEAPLARPGADAGDLMIGLAAARAMGIEPTAELRAQVFTAAVEAAGGPKAFRFHTDDHHAAEGEGAGCGHLKKAAAEPEAYGLDAEDMQAVRGALAMLKKHDAEEVVLRGAHGERGVIVIKDPDTALLHEVGGVQAFVYQEALHKARLAVLAERLAAHAPALAAVGMERLSRSLAEASDRQLNATLERLAAGLPVFAVQDGAVVPAGTVPRRGQ